MAYQMRACPILKYQQRRNHSGESAHYDHGTKKTGVRPDISARKRQEPRQLRRKRKVVYFIMPSRTMATPT